MPFSTNFSPRWSDLDPNGHVRHSAYSDYAAQARIAWFKEVGFDSRSFYKLNIGPILFREELKYLRELKLEESVRVTVELLYASEDGRKWGLLQNFYKPDGTHAAVVTVEGAWMNLEARKVTAAPAALAAAMRDLEPAAPAAN